MFWCEKICNELEIKKENGKVNILIIFFSGNEKNVIGIINKIENLFYLDGYYVIKVLDYNFLYLYGFNYFFKGKEYYNYLKSIENKYFFDIIFLVMNYNGIKGEGDVIIKVDDNY